MDTCNDYMPERPTKRRRMLPVDDHTAHLREPLTNATSLTASSLTTPSDTERIHEHSFVQNETSWYSGLLPDPSSAATPASRVQGSPCKTHQEDQMINKKYMIQDGAAEVDAERDIVCFGMLKGIPVSLVAEVVTANGAHIGSICLQGREVLELSPSLSVLGRIDQTSADVLKVLAAEEDLILQHCCSYDFHGLGGTTRSRKVSTPAIFEACLDVVIYGRLHLAEDLDDFLQACVPPMYLQDPVHCDRNVRYRNPQRLSFRDEESEMTFDLTAHDDHEKENFETPKDCLIGLESTEYLPETETPSAIRTPLLMFVPKALRDASLADLSGTRSKH